MPLPNDYPLTVDRMTATLASLAAGTTALGAPWNGRIIKIGVTIGSAVTTAVVINVDVAGVAVGTINVPTSTPLDTNAATVSLPVNIPCNEDDPINFVVASGAGGGVANVFAVVRAGG